MKKLLLFTVIFLGSWGGMSAQNTESNAAEQVPVGYEYVPIVREGVEWGYYWNYGVYGKNGHYSIRLKGDIEIKGKAYKKCYRVPYFKLNETTDLVGYMREENKKVYGIVLRNLDGSGMELTEERLLYDFNAKVGDPVAYVDGNPPGGIVERIEYIKFRDGKYRKKYYVEGGFFIEGLGRIDDQWGDLLVPALSNIACSICFASKLMYVFKTESHTYEADKYEYRDDLDDFYEYGTVERVSDDAPKFVIRQEDGQLIVDADCSCYDSAELIDTFGRTVKSATIANGETSVTIPTAGLTTGVYVVTISGSSAKTSQKIFIR